MLLRKFILPLLVVIPLLVSGQHSDGHSLLECGGAIPIDFLQKSSEKYLTARDSQEITDEERATKQTKDVFLLESSFLINQVLNSGRVLFNDPVSNYLGQILDTILVEEPLLRSQIRVYAVRSSVVNSFTTDDGIILVNLGLVAQLENEAQLAFILCHELAHFTQHHIINAYVKNEEMKKSGSQYRHQSFDEAMLAKSRYSKDLEKEADRIGLKRFLSTNYGSQSLLNVFEVMRYAHLPFDDIAFDRQFFNQGFYQIDDSYFLNQVRPVEAIESNDSERETHPSPTERQQLMSRYLSNSKAIHGRPDHLVSEQGFEQIRNTCRLELSALYLKAEQPVMSIYNSFLLSRSFPENEFLKKNIARALYMLSKFKTTGNYGYVHPGYSHIEGESQQLYHLFYHLTPEELCILATGYVWRLKAQLGDDQDIRTMSQDLLNDLMMLYYTPGMFAQIPPSEGWNRPDTTEIENKYDRLKQKSKDDPRLEMVKYALTDLFENAEFLELFEKLEYERWGNGSATVSKSDLIKKNRTDLRTWKNHGFALGLEKVVVVTPTYSKLDLRKKQQHKFLRSESAKNKLVSQIRKSTQLLNLELEILDASLLGPEQVSTFNDITFLNEWVDQRFLQLDADMANLDQSRIDSIIARHGTEYFSWTGVINYRENKPLMYFYLLYALIPPAIPFAIYYLARPNYDTYYYNITFNLRSGEPVLVNYSNYRKRDSRDLLNSSIYDSFWQMKRSERKKG